MSKRKPKPPKVGRVKYVSVSRLYNLGNYENRKIDISAEVAPRESASQTAKNLWWICEALKPLRRPSSVESYEAAIKKPVSEQNEYEKNHLEEWQEEYKTFCIRKELREKAIGLLDDLGGATVYTDHKEKWDFGDDTPF